MMEELSAEYVKDKEGSKVKQILQLYLHDG